MPRVDYVDITIVLDRSGSMSAVTDETIEGFNRFLTEQKSGHGSATMTLVQFDDQYEKVYAAVPIASAPLLNNRTFEPRGSTALLDAIGRTIDETGRRLAAMNEEDRPEQVMIVILTDGYENASRVYSIQKINEMIAHQRDVYSWEFIFLGANQDAIATAAAMGVGAGAALTYAANPDGTRGAFASVSRRVSDRRTYKDKSAFFEEQDRKLQDEEMKKGK